jgi:TfoX/Sxy family transcriptional regulator of competence genes
MAMSPARPTEGAPVSATEGPTSGAWKHVPAELAERFLAALPDEDDVQRRQMFGCPCAFVNGNMFAGLHEDRLLVRLPDEAAKRPAVIMGRTMKQYALFADAVTLARAPMAEWIRRAYAATRQLPPKLKAPARKRVAKR